MIYAKPPEDFKSRFDVVSAFVRNDGKFVLLHRLPTKSQGDQWGMPAGKVDEGETIQQALLRELREETGVVRAAEGVEYLDTVYVRYPDYDFVYYIFATDVADRSEAFHNPAEHQGLVWVSPTEALKMDLMPALSEIIPLIYGD